MEDHPVWAFIVGAIFAATLAFTVTYALFR